MTDPAVEAAVRHCDALPYGAKSKIEFDDLIDAAREALKPIREKCEELDSMFGDAATNVAAGVRLVLTQIAPLIYTSEELGQ